MVPMGQLDRLSPLCRTIYRLIPTVRLESPVGIQPPVDMRTPEHILVLLHAVAQLTQVVGIYKENAP